MCKYKTFFEAYKLNGKKFMKGGDCTKLFLAFFLMSSGTELYGFYGKKIGTDFREKGKKRTVSSVNSVPKKICLKDKT